MPKYKYVSLGSNTTVKSGPGTLYRILGTGANGGSWFAVDSISIGVTPNYVTQLSNSSNITAYGPITAAPDWIDVGADFGIGLTVAATSNSNITVIYD